MEVPRKVLIEFLNEKAALYNATSFIETDPVSVPHLFSKKQDIEIAGFLTATLSWGNRKSIISDSRQLMRMMDDDPHAFITGASDNELEPFRKFYHRTFNGTDCLFFVQSLRNIYLQYPSLEPLFPVKKDGMKGAICHFRKVFLETPHEYRSEKHISNPAKGSSAKRINMFLRWMVRKDNAGVDFGLWDSIPPSRLICPLDVHSARVGRVLNLLKRRVNDWKAAEELTLSLRRIDAKDPVRYDYALFGLGAFERF